MAVDIYSRGRNGAVTGPSSSDGSTGQALAYIPIQSDGQWIRYTSSEPRANWLTTRQVDAMVTSRPTPTLGEVALEIRRQAYWLYQLPQGQRSSELALLRQQDPSRYALVRELLISMDEPMSDNYVRPTVDVAVPSNPTPVAEPFEIMGIDWASPPRSQTSEISPFPMVFRRTPELDYGGWCGNQTELDRLWAIYTDAPPTSPTFTAKPRTPAVKEPTVCATPTGRRPAPRHRGPKSQP